MSFTITGYRLRDWEISCVEEIKDKTQETALEYASSNSIKISKVVV